MLARRDDSDGFGDFFFEDGLRFVEADAVFDGVTSLWTCIVRRPLVPIFTAGSRKNIAIAASCRKFHHGFKERFEWSDSTDGLAGD